MYQSTVWDSGPKGFVLDVDTPNAKLCFGIPMNGLSEGVDAPIHADKVVKMLIHAACRLKMGICCNSDTASLETASEELESLISEYFADEMLKTDPTGFGQNCLAGLEPLDGFSCTISIVEKDPVSE